MKPRNILLLVVMSVVLVSIVYSFLGSQDQSAYREEIEKERAEKDRFMRSSPESPFADDPSVFTSLNYYPADIRYRVTADLTPVGNKKTVTLATNDGKEQRYVQYATAEFDLDGYHNKLSILEIIDSGPYQGKLFLAFGDATSAVETYGAGRYLDVNKVPGSNTITFYVLTLYLGAARVRDARYILFAALAGDLMAFVVATAACRWLFPELL
jgi:uncharacterized protein (DUF1684 family)